MEKAETPKPESKSEPPARGQKSTLSGAVDFASLLSKEILLIVGWFRAHEESTVEASLFRDGEITPLETQWMPYRRPDLLEIDPLAGKLLVLNIGPAIQPDGRLGSLVVKVGGATFGIGPSEISRILDDFETVVQNHFAALERDTRTAMTDFLASALGRYQEPQNAFHLSRNLYALRELLRRRFPVSSVAPDQPRGLHVDALIGIDEKSYYIKGWMRDTEAPTTRLTVVSPEGRKAELLTGAFRHYRPDIEQFYGSSSAAERLKYGFVSYFEIEEPSYMSTGWILEMVNAASRGMEVRAPAAILDGDAAVDNVLADLAWERVEAEELTLHHIFPAISRIQDRRRERVRVADEHAYGPAAKEPEVSIIVPLYQRIEFLEHQLAQFVHDPEIRKSELIYVLDSPELADRLRDRASQLWSFYRVPFRLIILEQNAGFSMVNNVGASLARGRLLLLLNSDVLPDGPGWLGKLIECYDARPDTGALGPKLLYEDGSLQHAGMYFNRLPGSRLWENRHYFKGLHRRFPAADCSRAVPAVTAACLMIDRGLYEETGGLSHAYVRGGYEDSDLCLRLTEAGRRNRYASEVELYHLEGQSYPLPVRQLGLRYNRWLHTRLWGESMERITAEFPFPTPGDYPAQAAEGKPASRL